MGKTVRLHIPGSSQDLVLKWQDEYMVTYSIVDKHGVNQGGTLNLFVNLVSIELCRIGKEIVLCAVENMRFGPITVWRLDGNRVLQEILQIPSGDTKRFRYGIVREATFAKYVFYKPKKLNEVYERTWRFDVKSRKFKSDAWRKA